MRRRAALLLAAGIVVGAACQSSEDAADQVAVSTTAPTTVSTVPPLPPTEGGLPSSIVSAGVDLIKARHPSTPEPVLRELVVAIMQACQAEFFVGQGDPTAPDLTELVTTAPAEFGGPETVADDVADLCRPGDVP